MIAPSVIASSCSSPYRSEYSSTAVPSGRVPNARLVTDGTDATVTVTQAECRGGSTRSATLPNQTAKVLDQLPYPIGAPVLVFVPLIDWAVMLIDEMNDTTRLTMSGDEQCGPPPPAERLVDLIDNGQQRAIHQERSIGIVARCAK